MDKLKKINIQAIKRILQKRGYKVSKKKESFLSFYYTSYISIFLILIFYSIPLVINFSSKVLKKNAIIINTSNKNFNRVLEGKQIEVDQKNESDFVNKEELFMDILNFNIDEKDTVRLSASTLEELFKETKYSLKEIRQSKIVKPINIDLLPKEMKSIESSKKKKELFIKIVLPLILEENNRIFLDRKRLFAILNKNKNTETEKKWLNNKFKQYGVVNRDLTTLKIRMEIIPVSLAIAQAAKETGWGTSRFALEGNALYGQWTWSEDGITPASAEAGTTHKVMKFKILQASVRAYQRNLNTHSSYRQFRKERAIQRDNNNKLNSLELVNYLNEYAETGKEYTIILKKIIEQNSLTDFDDAKLLPTSEKIKKLI